MPEYQHAKFQICKQTTQPTDFLDGGPMTLADRVALFERRALIRILRKANGNVANAARLAGHNRTNFYRLLQRRGLDPAAFRTTT